MNHTVSDSIVDVVPTWAQDCSRCIPVSAAQFCQQRAHPGIVGVGVAGSTRLSTIQPLRGRTWVCHGSAARCLRALCCIGAGGAFWYLHWDSPSADDKETAMVPAARSSAVPSWIDTLFVRKISFFVWTEGVLHCSAVADDPLYLGLVFNFDQENTEKCSIGNSLWETSRMMGAPERPWTSVSFHYCRNHIGIANRDP